MKFLGLWPATWVSFILIFVSGYFLPDDQWFAAMGGFVAGAVVCFGQALLIVWEKTR